MTSLTALLRESFANDTPLARFRATLAEEDQAALDVILQITCDAKLGSVFELGLTSGERALLLIAARQQQQIQCLEFFLKRQAQLALAEETRAHQHD